MVTVGIFSRLVSGIYAAAVTPDQWAAAVGEIRRTFDGTASGLFMADSAVWSVLDSTLPADVAQSYAEYYHRLDHVLAAVGRGPAGAVRTGRSRTTGRCSRRIHAGQHNCPDNGAAER
jgi:hypothetical protein